MTCHHHMSSSPFCYHGLAMIPACICNRVNFGVWDGVACPFPDFGGATVEVWEWMSDFVAHITGHAIACPCWDWGWTMLVEGAPGHLSTWTIPFLVILSKQRTTTLSRVIRFFSFFIYTIKKPYTIMKASILTSLMLHVLCCRGSQYWASCILNTEFQQETEQICYVYCYFRCSVMYIYVCMCVCVYICIYVTYLITKISPNFAFCAKL